jgi:hypothetical protein
VTGTLRSTGTGRRCSPPGAPAYSVPGSSHTTRITGRKTAAAFDLRFEGGLDVNVPITGGEANRTLVTESGGGDTSRTTIALKRVDR